MADLGPFQWQGTNVDVTTLEVTLADLWKGLTSRNRDIHPVRTRLFNLVVYARDASEAKRVMSCLSELRRVHPSRTVILLCDRLDRTSHIDAELTLDCEEHPGDLPTCCHERIQLSVCGRASDHLASIVIPLLIPELPTYLWWPGQPLFGHRVFHRLLRVADQLVVDSAQFDSPGDGLADLAHIAAGKLGVNDFNWARLTPWREVIAQFFDGSDLKPYADAIRSVRLEFGRGEGNSTRGTATVLLLLGWIGSRLGWEPETTLDRPAGEDVTLTVLQHERIIPVELQFREHGTGAACQLMDVEIVSQPRGLQPATFLVHRSADLQTVHISTQLEGEQKIARVIPLSILGDSDLLANELEITSKDALYDAVVQAASRMAGREVWTLT